MHILEIIFAFGCGIRQMYNFQSSKHFVTLWKAHLNFLFKWKASRYRVFNGIIWKVPCSHVE
jgi:hypothetical protein